MCDHPKESQVVVLYGFPRKFCKECRELLPLPGEEALPPMPVVLHGREVSDDRRM